MRLIDADALKELMDFHVTSMSVCISMDEHNGMQFMKEQCIEDVQNAPTIDAIPVEWLLGLMLSTEDDVDNVEFDWIMREWESEKKEQEAR